MIKFIKNIIPVILCLFLSSTQLKVYLPFVNSLVVLVAGLGISLLFYRDFYKQAFISWIVLYAIVLVMNNLMGDYYFQLITNVIEELCLLLFPAALSFYIITQKQYSAASWLIFTFFILMIYSSIATFIVVMLFPDAVRTTVFLMEHEETDVLRLYYSMGMVSYKFCHALPIIIPALVYSFLRSNKMLFFRIISFIALLAVLITIYLSNAATALLLALFALVASVFVSKKSPKVTLLRLVTLGLVLIPFIVSSDLLVDLLQAIGSLFTDDKSAYIDRFEDIKSMSESGKASGDLGGRMDKYSISLSILEGNIILGSNMPTGEHSALLDRLASLGLVGWIPYMIYIIKNTLKQSKIISKKVISYFFIGAVSALIMMATKNMSNWDTWFMFFGLLPVLLWYASLDSQEVEQLKHKK